MEAAPTKPTGLQRILRDTIVVGLAAWVCSMFYYNGKEEGRREALRQIAPISNSLPLMKSHLQENGIYMFEEEELTQFKAH